MEDFPSKDVVSDIITKARYMTLATASMDIKNGKVEVTPHSTPVFFAFGRQLTMYWLSAVDSQHSQNILQNGKVSGVIFDSSVPQGTGVGFSFNGHARLVTKDDIAFPHHNEMETGIKLLCEKGETLDQETLMKPDCPRKLFKVQLNEAWYNGAIYNESANVWIDKTVDWNIESTYGRLGLVN